MDREAKAVNPLSQYFLRFASVPKQTISFANFGKIIYTH
jgi:hypothetical protein